LFVLNSTREDIETRTQELENKIKEKSLSMEEYEEKIKNIDFLNESLSSKSTTLKSQIVHSPEKLQIIIEELKVNKENLSTNIQESNTTIKNCERHQKILESLTKIFNENENLILDLDKVINNLTQVNAVIYEDTECKNKKEKNLNEFESKIDNLTKTLNNLGEYTVEFYRKQKSALVSKDELLASVKEKFQSHQKRLNEINEMIKVQMSNNKAFEENVK
jgi:chromosome segregation ATPase